VKDIIASLNKVVGVKGSMVVTPDGIVVASALENLGKELNEETVAALSSHMIVSGRRALERIGHQPFNRVILNSSWGRLIFLDLEIAFLVVIASENIKLGNILIEIDSTAYKIRHRRTN
jgi:hypothetical protein